MLQNVANSEKQEINIRIRNANKCYFGLIRYLWSKLLTYSTKVRLYKTLIKPVLMYGSETWVLNENDQKKLGTFERKILRKIYGPVNEKGEWRIWYNKELYELYKSSDIIT